jgi:hypothetical protein
MQALLALERQIGNLNQEWKAKPCPNPEYKPPHLPAPARGAQRDARALFLPLRFLLRPLAPLEKANLSARRLLASGSPLM